MNYAFSTVVSALGLLVGMVAVGLVLYASGLTGGAPAAELVLVGAGVFVVGVVTFGYGTGKRTGY